MWPLLVNGEVACSDDTKQLPVLASAWGSVQQKCSGGAACHTSEAVEIVQGGVRFLPFNSYPMVAPMNPQTVPE